MNFAEKNDWTIRLRNVSFFEKDKKLFREHFPNSKLEEQLKNANEFTRPRLSEKIIFELLSVVSPEEIMKNRSAKKTTEKKDKTSKKDSEQVNIPENIPEKIQDDNEIVPPIFEKPEDPKKKEETMNFPV